MTDPPVPLVSVVIPAYNEAARIKPGLEQILQHVAATALDCEIILVDDGSSDDTADVVRRHLNGSLPLRVLRQEPNQGKARAVRRGMLAATGRFAGYVDADMSTPFAEIDRFLQALADGADVAIGSRSMEGSDVQVRQPLQRALAGKLFGAFTRLVLLPGLHDSQCGFKFFRREVAQDLFTRQQLTGWAFDAELLFLARRLGYRVVQLPVRWINDPNTKVKMLKAGPKMVLDILKIRWRHRRVRR
jgi:glycosyltransferase involved in cell wall biosynthesis